MVKQYYVSVEREVWNCGEGCCSETKFWVEIIDRHSNKTIFDSDLYDFELNSDYNTEEEILSFLNGYFGLDMSLDNTEI